jgi:hypothetical protein
VTYLFAGYTKALVLYPSGVPKYGNKKNYTSSEIRD